MGKVASKEEWGSLEDVRRTYSDADGIAVGNRTCTVFNICRNQFRLVVQINYQFKMIFFKRLMAHANETYGSLLMQTRSHIIRDDNDHKRRIELLETLVSQNHLTPEQEELVGVLKLLIHDYEKRFVIDGGATQAAIVQHLMQANHLSPKDPEPVLGTKSAVSMALL